MDTSRYSPEFFRTLLMTKRHALASIAQANAEQALRADTPEGAGSISAVPLHPAELASDASNQDSCLTLMQRQEGEISEIDDALDRMKLGLYGICEECEEAIPPRRLEVIPEARYCVECEEACEKASLTRHLFEDAEVPNPRDGLAPIGRARSTDPDWRVLEAPRTRLVGTRDLRRDYVNLYAGADDLNDAFGRGGYPSNYYGRDSRPDLDADISVLHESDNILQENEDTEIERTRVPPPRCRTEVARSGKRP